jgi:hypothetical protein
MEYFKSVPQISTTREWKVLPKTPYFNRPHIAIQSYVDGFALECAALAWARREMGLANIKVMIPFRHTIDEGGRVIELMAANRLKQGEGGLEAYAIPAETSTAAARIGSF